MPRSVQDQPSIQVTFLSTWLIDLLKKLPRVFYLVYAVLRTLIQIVQLFWHLLLSRLSTKPYDFLLI